MEYNQPEIVKFCVGVFVPIPSLEFVLSQYRFDDCVSPLLTEPNTSCPVENPDSIPPVSVQIPTLFPTRESPVQNVITFSLELNIFQSVAERAPVVVEVARAMESCCPTRESPLAFARESAS